MESRDRKQTPQAIWKEEDMISGRKVRTMVLILRTVGCWWSQKKGCLMCGYNQATSEKGIGTKELMSQLEVAMESYDGEEMVKVYTSGSFLDEREVPADVRERLFNAFPSCQNFLIESRPEFVTEKALSSLPRDRMEIAIGLESSSDEILHNCINKGFGVKDYERAAKLIRQMGMRLRTYLLLKPPYLTELQALDDAISSIRFASSYSENISLNPVNVQKETHVESLFRRGDYRPPWLWSVVEVLKRGKEGCDSRVFSIPSGAGTPRGAHNCFRCDPDVISALHQFSFSQDISVFQGLSCDCQRIWKAQLELQNFMRTSVDIDKYLSDDLGFNQA
ncbi:MAG: archaeosine biosynthesis radical SAM protein RaSEA [Methanomassiliicoccales archaeon]